MLTRLLLSLLFAISLLIPASVTPITASAADCQFALGFKLLHDLIPDVVGACKTNEYHNAQNGDGLQETTAWHGKGGLLAWRKADNWTAFTDGANTWVNGPNGIQKRANSERFAFEADDRQPTPTTPQCHPDPTLEIPGREFGLGKIETVPGYRWAPSEVYVSALIRNNCDTVMTPILSVTVLDYAGHPITCTMDVMLSEMAPLEVRAIVEHVQMPTCSTPFDLSPSSLLPHTVIVGVKPAQR